jgi:hypothetical protein
MISPDAATARCPRRLEVPENQCPERWARIRRFRRDDLDRAVRLGLAAGEHPVDRGRRATHAPRGQPVADRRQRGPDRRDGRGVRQRRVRHGRGAYHEPRVAPREEAGRGERRVHQATAELGEALRLPAHVIGLAGRRRDEECELCERDEIAGPHDRGQSRAAQRRGAQPLDELRLAWVSVACGVAVSPSTAVPVNEEFSS